jgi:hypothetical protein
MRLLILTHERSGGMTLLDWLGRELGLNSYHEPFNTNIGPVDILTLDNIIVKEFPHHIEDWCTISLNEFISTFDYVIVLTRENTYQTAISSVFMGSKERGTEHAHTIYTMNDGWIEKYESDILLKQKELDSKIEILKNIPNGLQVTYERIYENTDDIKKIYQYVGLKFIEHRDILNNKYRLRNGKFEIPKFSHYKRHKNLI